MAHGIVYAGSGDSKLYAFAADGATNCAGTPTAAVPCGLLRPEVCTPLWTAQSKGQLSSPTVANGVVSQRRSRHLGL